MSPGDGAPVQWRNRKSVLDRKCAPSPRSEKNKRRDRSPRRMQTWNTIIEQRGKIAKDAKWTNTNYSIQISVFLPSGIGHRVPPQHHHPQLRGPSSRASPPPRSGQFWMERGDADGRTLFPQTQQFSMLRQLQNSFDKSIEWNQNKRVGCHTSRKICQALEKEHFIRKKILCTESWLFGFGNENIVVRFRSFIF